MSLRSSRSAFSAAAALHRVFIAPIESSHLALQRHHAQARLPLPTALKLCLPVHHRCYASGPPSKNPPKRRLPRNNEIKSNFIQLVDEDGKLSTPQTTWDVMNQIDTTTHSLVTVSQPTPRQPTIQGETQWEDSTEQEFPICKILNNKDLWEREKSKTKKTKNPARTTKVIELNWAIDGNDLKHRVDRIREFLEKGYRVEVIMAGKRKGRKATQEEADDLLKSVKAVLENVPGAKEMKGMAGKVLEQATLYFEGKVQKKEV